MAFLYCEYFCLRYWHPVKASVDTGRVDPATGVIGGACNSFGEQFKVPPDDGTNAMPSMVYAAGRRLCVSDVPPAANAPT